MDAQDDGFGLISQTRMALAKALESHFRTQNGPFPVQFVCQSGHYRLDTILQYHRQDGWPGSTPASV
jgi:hypothetical protein